MSIYVYVKRFCLLGFILGMNSGMKSYIINFESHIKCLIIIIIISENVDKPQQGDLFVLILFRSILLLLLYKSDICFVDEYNSFKLSTEFNSRSLTSVLMMVVVFKT